MFLSRLVLNLHSRQVQRELADVYQMHRTIMSAFPADLPGNERVLFRLDPASESGGPVLLVQSLGRPNWQALSAPGKDYLLEKPAIKEFGLRIQTGQQLVFRLRANPTMKKTVPDKKNGQRVGLYREDEQLAWLQRKLGAAGASLKAARAGNQDQMQSYKKSADGRQKLEFLAVRFEGLLEVQDPERLLQAVQQGIGSGKGLGFGLLSLAPGA